MTVTRLRELLEKQEANGNGHMPVGIALDNFGVQITAGLFGDVKIGVEEQYDKVWIYGVGGVKTTQTKIPNEKN